MSVSSVPEPTTSGGYHATFDFNPVTLSVTDQLLFRLNLEGETPGSDSIGVLSAKFLRDQLVADPSDPSYADNLVPFSSTNGEITVAGTTAVPEPSSAVLLGLAFAFGISCRRNRKV